MPTVVTRDLESKAASPSSYVVGGETSGSAPSFPVPSGALEEVVAGEAVVPESLGSPEVPGLPGGGVVVSTTMPPVLEGWVVVVG